MGSLSVSRFKVGEITSRLMGGFKVLTRSRLHWWPAVITSFLVGTASVSTDYELSTTFILSLIFICLPYHLLRYGVSDIFDFVSRQQIIRRVDAPQFTASEKNLPGALFWIVLVNMAVLVPLMLSAPPAARLWVLALSVVALGYGLPTVRFKDTPLFDILSFGAFIAGPLVLAQLIAGAESISISLLGVFFFWAAGNYLFGSIQDIELDRLSWTRSSARLLGYRASVLVSTLFYIASSVLAYVAVDGHVRWVAALPLLYALNAIRFLKVSNPDLYALGWRMVLRLTYLSCILILAFLADSFYRT